jgi:uroporphyrinogen III methyltransferase / synthase
VKKGFVFLVGAGPGRPDLLTLRGAEALARADAVVLDALVDRRVLAHCRPGARVVDAGKRGHGKVLMRQPAINRLLVRLAAGGKTVVRLKGGDPYFFGRGGEEAGFLRRRGVPFEVVPGVSSAVAVPAYAGIPVTHRGLTSTLTVVTGHEGLENPYLLESSRDRAARLGPGVDWEKLDPRNTLVILMGLGRLPRIAARLRAAGWPASTPAAVVQSGTLPAQKTFEGTLGDIARKAAGAAAPAVIVLGDVVRRRRDLNWFERLPLFGRTVLVTRASSQASELTRALEARGARALEGPAIRVEPLPLTSAGRAHMKNLSAYDAVLFTSPNAVTFLPPLLGKGRGEGVLWPPKTAVYAVGPKTAEALVARGIPVHAVARVSRAEGLSSLLRDVKGKRFLFPRAAAGRDTLVADLSRRGARVDLWPLYRTLPEPMDPAVRRALLAGGVDAVCFASGSAVDAFLDALTPAQRRRVFSRTRAVSIGPVTTAALKSRGVRRVVESPSASLDAMADALARSFRR